MTVGLTPRGLNVPFGIALFFGRGLRLYIHFSTGVYNGGFYMIDSQQLLVERFVLSYRIHKNGFFVFHWLNDRSGRFIREGSQDVIMPGTTLVSV